MLEETGRWVYLAHDRNSNAIWLTIDLNQYMRRIEVRAMQREICLIRAYRKSRCDEWAERHFSAPSWGTEFVTQVLEHMDALAVGAAIVKHPQQFLENPIVFLSAIGWDAQLELEEHATDEDRETKLQLKMITQFPNGHKYFQDQEGHLHLADSSGDTPLETEDGDLVVDFEREMSISQDEQPVRIFLIPVQDSNGNRLTTPAYFHEARWLRDDRGMKVDKQARCLFNAFETPS